MRTTLKDSADLSIFIRDVSRRRGSRGKQLDILVRNATALVLPTYILKLFGIVPVRNFFQEYVGIFYYAIYISPGKEQARVIRIYHESRAIANVNNVINVQVKQVKTKNAALWYACSYV